ncbi:MAG: hypothetical protein ACRENH_16675 [Gemmatimonadaceae bacterium]
MHVGVIELLRCPTEHSESALVASATRQVERRIIEGSLGCPVCGAEFRIHNAVADFRRDTGAQDLEAVTREPPNEEDAIRLAAQLDLTEPGRLLLIFGEYTRFAPALNVMFDALCVAINAPRREEDHIADHSSVLRIATTIPIAPSAAHGAAISGNQLRQLQLDQVRERLRVNGRLVIPATAALPEGMTLVAHDERELVGVRASEMISLRRAR